MTQAELLLQLIMLIYNEIIFILRNAVISACYFLLK
jgi:hypothetical protein